MGSLTEEEVRAEAEALRQLIPAHQKTVEALEKTRARYEEAEAARARSLKTSEALREEMEAMADNAGIFAEAAFMLKQAGMENFPLLFAKAIVGKTPGGHRTLRITEGSLRMGALLLDLESALHACELVRPPSIRFAPTPR